MLNKQIESRQGSDSIGASSIGNDSQGEEDEDGGQGGSMAHRRDILWAFTNADKLKQDYWNRLESRMLDIYQGHPGIRFLLTSSAESKKFLFTCFKRDEELQEMQEELEEYKGVQNHPDQSKTYEKQMKARHCRKVDLILSKLKDHESVDLVLYHT